MFYSSRCLRRYVFKFVKQSIVLTKFFRGHRNLSADICNHIPETFLFRSIRGYSSLAFRKHRTCVLKIFLYLRGCIFQLGSSSRQCDNSCSNRSNCHNNRMSGNKRHCPACFCNRNSQTFECRYHKPYAADYNRNHNIKPIHFIGRVSEEIYNTCKRIVPSFNCISIKQRIEIFLCNGKPLLRCCHTVEINRILFCSNAIGIQGQFVQLISTAVMLNALGHIIHQRKEYVLLFNTCHRCCNIGLCFAVQIAPFGCDLFKDCFHLAPVAVLIHQRNIDLRQCFRNVIDPCFVFLVITGRLDLVQTCNNGIKCGTNRPCFLSGRLRHCRNICGQPFHGNAERTGRRCSFLHCFTNFLTGCCRMVANIQEYVRNTLCRIAPVFRFLFNKAH